MESWSATNNKLGENFQLYSSLEDAKEDKNRWKYCNYDESSVGIGFPYDCGPEEAASF